MKFLTRLFRKVTGKLTGFFLKMIARRRQVARAIFQIAYCVGSATLSVYVLGQFLPAYLVAAIVSTVVVHEFGHWITAKRLDRQVDLPFFVPLVWFVFSATRLHNKGSNPETDAKIHLAGPSWGFIWAVAGAAVAGWYAYTQLAWAFAWLAAFNIWHGTFGSDGKFYSAMKEQLDATDKAASYAAREVIEGSLMTSYPLTPIPTS
jgi:Zn-dependent protease